MSDVEGSGVTDEQRAEVMRLLFELMRAHGDNIEDGVEILRYAFVGEIGKITIDFEPEAGLVDWAVRASTGIIEGMFDAAADKLINEGQLESKPLIKAAYVEEPAALFAYFAVEGLKGKLRSAFYELGLETEKLFEGFVESVMNETGFIEQTGFTPGTAAGVRALSKSMATERRQFLNMQINRFKRKPRLERLPELYPMLLKVWQSAKKIYDDNGESETWRGMVKAKYPDLTFDDDLLTRVTGKMETLPEDIQAKIIEKDADHTPNTIALEHAARMCGASPYQYGTRYLHKLKSEGAKTELTETE